VSLARHLRLFILATLTWAAFWILGLPSYYQQYSTWTMAGFSVAVLTVLVVLLPRVFRRIRVHRRMTAAWWMAFYFTVPLAGYDALYCGVHLGHGWAFLWRYWYLTIYYFIPWVVLPAAAALAGEGERVSAERMS
jgi:hypothetical protein